MTYRLVSSFRRRSDLLVPPLIFILISAFIFALFFLAVYPGFSLDPSTWEVTDIFASQQRAGEALQEGDILLKIGQITLSDYQSNRNLELFAGLRRGDHIPLLVQRDGHEFAVDWTVSGPNASGVRDRVFSAWWLAYVFWAFGSATFLFLRPRDARWQLLIAFNYICALGIAAGTSSSWPIWQSGVWYRSIMWFAIPIFIHLHWVFPLRLKKVPAWIAWAGYGAAAICSIAQWFQVIPNSLESVGLIAAMVISIGLLVVHHSQQPNVRRTLSMLLFGAIIAFIPAILIGLIRLVQARFEFSSLMLVAFPVLPGTYFIAIYRRQFGGIELRANRIISLYIFLTGLMAFNLLALSVVSSYSRISSTAFFLAMLLPLFAASLVVLVFPKFQRWIERRLLGIPLPPTHLVERYAARISTSPEPKQLVEILRDDVLRSLMVRQSALLCYDDAGKTYFLYKEGVDDHFTGRDDCLQSLWASAGRYRSPAILTQDHPAVGWVRLAIPLMAGSRRVGIWLLGRRDPDDFFAQVEIPTLQALADQTAIALLNHQQAEHLSRLYQVDIDRQEVERLQLALELHDGVLNQLGILALTVDEHNDTFEAAYHKAATHIRQIISGLRPTMLNYGLRAALDELADEAPAQANTDVEIQIDLEETDVRYDPQLELHLYRIVQEACKNALQHAQARTIRIFGSLRADCFDLTIMDDGAGFSRGQHLELDGLLAEKHFGLAGIIERARLIGALIDIASVPGEGTRVRVYGNLPK